MRLLMTVLLATLLAGCDFIGGAETLVRGSHNFVGEDGSAGSVAFALARLEGTPVVTDEELAEIYAVIREQALAGDLSSAQVLLQLAAIQRTPEPEED